MPEFSETTKNVRKYLLDTIIATGSAPNVGMIMGELNLPKSSAMDSLKELERGVAIVMEPYTENIRMVHPLANISTPYQVTVDGEKKWWGEWALESLAIPYLFPGKNVEVSTYCLHCMEPIYLKARDGEILEVRPESIVAHFGIPRKKWGDNAIHAWDNMNFFSSEEHVAEWEKEHPEYKGATITLDQAHKYITFVGRDRLNYDYSYPAGAAEYQSSIGITGEFWARWAALL